MFRRQSVEASQVRSVTTTVFDIFTGRHPYRVNVRALGLHDYRDTDSEGTGWDVDSVGDDRSRPHGCARADHGVMEHHGARTDQALVLEDAPLKMDEVAHDTPVTDTGGKARASMDDGPVLNRTTSSHGDLAIVTSKDRTGPYRGVWSEGHGSDHNGVRVDESLAVNVGDQVTECVERHGQRRYRSSTTARHRSAGIVPH